MFVAVIGPRTRSALRKAAAHPRLGQSLQNLIMQELLASLKGFTNVGTVAQGFLVTPDLHRTSNCQDDPRIFFLGENSDVNRTISSRTERSVMKTAEWLLLVILLGVFVGRALVPAWRTLNTDFPNYYLTALLRSRHIPIDRAYEWIWFQRQKDHNDIPQPLVGFAPHPPLCAAPMLLLASLGALPAKHVWIVLNLLFLIAALCILHRLTRFGWRRILLITGLCILPLRSNFMLGQYYVVILLFICLAYCAIFYGHRFTGGALLAAAAGFKVFPAVFILLFLRKRDWRAVSGLIVGSLAVGAVSVAIFGLDAHRVWLFEVLPRALRGDMLGPYDVHWSSFSSLWHRLFLFEPGLNPAPILGSPPLYALVQAFTSTILLFAFLFSTGDATSERTTAWEWAKFIPLLLLLSSMASSYHYVLLIFTLVVGLDVIIRAGRWHAAALLLLLYVIACAPLPSNWVPLTRLLATLGLYVVLLGNAPLVAEARARKILWALAGLIFVVVAGLSLSSSKKRDQDFLRRFPQIKDGYGSYSPAATSSGIVAIEMVDGGYRAVMSADGNVFPLSSPGDILSIAASAQSHYIYFELADRGSHILRFASERNIRSAVSAEYVTEGQQPSLSYDGRWLAFIREDRGRTAIWRSHDGSNPERVAEKLDLSAILEMSVTTEGDIIAASGSAASPRLVLLPAATGAEKPLDEIVGAVRYPAVSPNAKLLAFSRRESNSWHLFVREFSTGTERRLTGGDCNATSPAWEDQRTLVYTTDCGRGYGLNAVARIVLDE